MPTQTYASGMVENLATAFPRRNESSFAWGNAISYYLNLPQLRGFWPMSSVNESGNVYDLSGQGRILTNTNTATFGVYGLQSYTALNGVNQYHSRADEAGLDITGALTIGGWFRPASVAANQGVMIKGDNSVNSAYWLYVQPASTIRLGIWNGGAITVMSSTIQFVVNKWFFWTGRYTPSTEISIFQDNTKSTNVVAIPASATNSASPFNIGSFSGAAGSVYYSGYSSLNFLCAAALSDAQIKALYWLTKSLFHGT